MMYVPGFTPSLALEQGGGPAYMQMPPVAPVIRPSQPVPPAQSGPRPAMLPRAQETPFASMQPSAAPAMIAPNAGMLPQPEYIGGPARMPMPLVPPSAAPAIMQTSQQGALPTASQPTAAQNPTGWIDYTPPTAPTLYQSVYTPQELANRQKIQPYDPETFDPEQAFRRADPNFMREVSDSYSFYRDPDTGFFFSPDGSQIGAYFQTNRGGAATRDDAAGFATFNPNFQYRLVDAGAGNNVIFSGTGAEGLTGVRTAAQTLARDQGDKANWMVEQFDPRTGQWTTVARDKPPSNTLGKIADIALPIAASFIPGIGPIAGAALGSAASSVAQGRSLENTLLRAGLSAGTAGLVQGTGLDQALGNVLAGKASGVAGGTAGGLSGSAAGSAVGNAVSNIGNEIIVTGARNALTGLTSGITGALGGVAGSVGGSALSGATPPSSAPVQPTTSTEGNPIVVTGNLPPATPPLAGALSGVAGAAPGLVYDSPEGQLTEIVAEQPRPVQEEFDAVFPVAPPVSTPAAPPAEGQIIVEGESPGQFDFPDELATLPPLAAIPTITGGTVNGPQTPDAAETPSEGDGILDKLKNLGLSDYLRIAGLLSALGGDLFGGGGRGGLNTIPAGFGSSGLNPVFGGSLPSPSARTAATPRPMGGTDWYRYGYGPGQSFFSNVPQGEPNTSTAYTGYAMGGDVEGTGPSMLRESFAVRGEGHGRSDDVPAMLSDGEYVIDAETVSLLGDGSNDAGAEILDQFRVNLRKDKGRKLAKGEFSVKAKRPEQYMYGGRA